MTIESLSDKTLSLLNSEISKQKLPDYFLSTVIDFYWPVACQLNQASSKGSKFVGIQGSQGSGKSTIADFLKILLESEFQKSTLVMSIDDFYLTKEQRKQLSIEMHPLLVTRGVPGTHDIGLLNSVFDHAKQSCEFSVPVFDKSIDDRASESEFQLIQSAVDILILEGWCVGLSAQTDEQIKTPINNLERDEDSSGIWRFMVNEALKQQYKPVFDRLDYQIFLQAPSFECVYDWRLLQEQKMVERLKRQGKDTSGALNKSQITRFISHYQRLTEHALNSMPARSNCVLSLNKDHSFTSINFH